MKTTLSATLATLIGLASVCLFWPNGDNSQSRATHLPQSDNPDYEWIDPTPHPHQSNNCGNCHADIHREWAGSAHAHSATNPRVLAVFAALVRDRPDDTGVCAKCHAPTMRDPTLDYDLRTANEIDRHGVHCDFCHKVVDAGADKLGTRFGIDGLTLLRPTNGQLLFFGPLDDAVREVEQLVFSPVYKSSRYCASCHEGVIYGTHVYGTFSEWLASPARKEGKQCQSCHMAPSGKMTNIARGHGGLERDSRTLASHTLPGATKEMLQRCLSVKVTIKGRAAEVEVKAENVGHRVPTGSPDHELVLRFEPRFGTPSEAISADVRTKVYAKRFWSNRGQFTPFWLPHDETQDTRLKPDKTDRAQFLFGGELNAARVQLIYARYGGFDARDLPPESLSDGVIFVFNEVIPAK